MPSAWKARRLSLPICGCYRQFRPASCPENHQESSGEQRRLSVCIAFGLPDSWLARLVELPIRFSATVGALDQFGKGGITKVSSAGGSVGTLLRNQRAIDACFGMMGPSTESHAQASASHPGCAWSGFWDRRPATCASADMLAGCEPCPLHRASKPLCRLFGFRLCRRAHG